MESKQRKEDLSHTEDVLVLDDNITFSSMHLKPDLLKAFNDEGFIRPSPIQLRAIPRGKLGMDLICQSKSGTGKTLTFCTIILERLSISNNDSYGRQQDLTPQAMIITPTREIAIQIRDFVRKIGKYYKYLTCDTFIGGVPLSYDKKNLNLGCQIIIGTPGRILQLININSLITFNLKIIVFDEADQLFNADSFKLDIRNILLNKTPKNKQILAFSASYNKDNNIMQEISAFMRNPQLILISNDKPTLRGVQQYFCYVDNVEKKDEDTEQKNDDITKTALSRLRYDHLLLSNKIDNLLFILSSIPFNQCIVFINNKNRLKDICKILNENGFPSYNIGGDQIQTERILAIKKLKQFKIRVLVSSDLTSRGIDCDRVNLVINLDLPFNAETYLHRVGRTGRFGTYGLSITFITKDTKEIDTLNNYMQILSSKINKLPNNDTETLKTIVNQNYLNHALTLKNEQDQKQFKIFEKKREKALNTDHKSEKLVEPSAIIQDIYIQKETERVLWNSATKKATKPKKKSKKKKHKERKRNDTEIEEIEEKIETKENLNNKDSLNMNSNNAYYNDPYYQYWNYYGYNQHHQPHSYQYGYQQAYHQSQNNYYPQQMPYTSSQRQNDLMTQALKAAKCFHAMYG